MYDGACDFVDTVHASEPSKRFEIEAAADDDQGLSCILYTGPDFGCVHCELKRFPHAETASEIYYPGIGETERRAKEKDGIRE